MYYIRLANKEDLPEILGCLNSLSDTTYDNFDKVAEAYDISQNYSYIFVAMHCNSIVGTAKLVVEDKLSHGGSVVVHIEDVATRHDYKGKGVGTELMAYLVSFAKTLSPYKIILRCKPHLIPFYEKFGFGKTDNIEMRLDF